MKRFSFKKKLIAGGAALALAAGVGGAAFAYFTASGSGSGTATVGSSTALTVNQAGITYSNSATDDTLLPGTSATVTFTVDNTSSGSQQLGTISLSSVTSDKVGCDSTSQPTWFTASPLVVNHNYAPGLTQAVTGSMTVNFVDDGPQDACQGATLTLHYSA